MSALSPTPVPASATATFEKLIGWAGLALHRANPRQAVIEVAGNYAERVCQAVILTDTNGIDRLIVRASLELDPSWQSDTTQKLWYWVKPVSETIIAPTFFS